MNAGQPQVPRRWLLVLSFALGAAAVIYQSVFLREFMVLAFGNELAWGLVLLAWMAGVALGAAISGRWAAKTDGPRLVGALIWLAPVMALVAPTGPVLARTARSFFDLTPGQYIPFLDLAWLAAAAALPTALAVGFAFPLTCALFRSRAGASGAVRAVYVAEALGSLTGGGLFSFVLVAWLPPVSIVSVAGLGLLSAAVVLGLSVRQQARSAVLTAGALLVAVLVALVTGLAGWADSALVRARWYGMQGQTELVKSVDSRYQNIALGELAGQYSLYLDGLVATTFPDPVDFAPRAHLALCEHPDPQDVLVIGGGAEGLLSEILLHPVRHVDYVDLDPEVLAVIRPHLAAPDAQALTDRRLQLHHADGRFFIKRAPRQYDVILVNVPGPSSTLLNRFYTRQFFDEVSHALKPDGVLTFTLESAASHFTADRRRYLASVHQALAESFPRILMTWGDSSIVFATRPEGVITADSAVLEHRYRGRGVRSTGFIPEWFASAATDMMDPDKLAELRDVVTGANDVTPNSDEAPVAYFYHMVIWDELTGGRSGAVLGTLKTLREQRFWVFAAPLGVLGLWLGWSRLRRGPGVWAQPAAIVWSAATTGLSSLSLELVLLFAFQSLYGYVYQRVGIIVALFMFGLAAGAMLGRIGKAPPARLLKLGALDLAIALMLAMTPAVLGWAGTLTGRAAWCAETLIMTQVVAAGLVGGLAFRMCVELYQAGGTGAARTAGAVTAADNVGACLGALLAGVVLVPALGIPATCLFLAGLKLTSVVLLVAVTHWKRTTPVGARITP